MQSIESESGTSQRLPRCDEAPIWDIFAARTLNRTVEIAIRIGLIDALGEPLQVDDVSRRVGIGRRAASALMRVLVGAGLAELRDGEASLTDLARDYLVTDSPFYKGVLFQSISDEELELLLKVHLQDGMPRPMTVRWLRGSRSPWSRRSPCRTIR